VPSASGYLRRKHLIDGVGEQPIVQRHVDGRFNAWPLRMRATVLAPQVVPCTVTNIEAGFDA